MARAGDSRSGNARATGPSPADLPATDGHRGLHEALSRTSTDGAGPEDLLALAEDALRKHFPRDLVLVEPLDGVPRPGDCREPEDPAAIALRALAGPAAKAGRPHCVPDTRQLRSAEGRVLAAAGIDAAVMLPCVGPKEPLAAIAVARRGPDSIEEGEIATLAGFAAHLGTALHAATERAAFEKSYQALKDAQGQRVRTERLAAVGQMAAGVAHDFNNMLASIMVRAELLRQVLDKPEWISHLDVIERSAHDGARTVRRLQEFTRQESTQDFRPVDLNAAMRDSLEITKSRWKDDAQLSGVDIEVRVELGEIPPVLGDVSEIREVLTNLLVNAVDAMPGGGVLRVATRALPLGNRVELTVADTGTGMSDDVRAQVFDPFFTTKGPGGSGLGLSVSYGIIKRHGGGIAVQTAPGAGATFTVSFPGAAEEAAEAEEAPAAPRARLRILVVDDEEPFRVSLYTALHREGHFVAVAGSGEEALRLFRISSFDVVLTDLGMPGMSGWQVAEGVKRIRRGTPVVVITGWGATLTDEDRNRPEVDAVLAKPVTTKAILLALSRLPLGSGAGRGRAGRRRPKPAGPRRTRRAS